MPNVLLVADAVWVVNDVRAALDEGHTITLLEDPRLAAETWLEDRHDAVLIDLQVESMGGMAVTRAIRDAAATSGVEHPPIVLLLDREADGFLAGRSGAAASVRKPFDTFELRDLLDGLMARADGEA
jgi:DNA-binding response OmpR family regulator